MTNTPSLFPFVHDWAEPFALSGAWNTEIQQAFDGSEVRVQLRDTPTFSMSVRSVFLKEEGPGNLLATWRSATRPLLYYAPLWCDVTELTATATASDTTLHLTATDRPFFDLPATGTGAAMIWRSELNAEVVHYDAADSSSLTLTDGVVGSYAIAGTKVVPVRPMWLSVPVNVNWHSGRIASATFTFTDLKSQAAFGYTGASEGAVVVRVAIFRDRNLQYQNAPFYTFAEAVAYDSADQPIPEAVFTWESSNEDVYTVHPDLSTRRARVSVLTNGLNEHITVTCDGVSTSDDNG